jgi:hypothetical protein
MGGECVIEALIDYIQQKGYQVRVEKKYIVLWKEINGLLVQLPWRIDDESIRYSRSNDLSLLKLEADHRIHQFDEAIAKGPPKT